MARITVDAALRDKLLAAKDMVELVDEAGAVIGQFAPPNLGLFVYDEISDEELERRSQPGRKRYTTQEVLDRLRKLG